MGPDPAPVRGGGRRPHAGRPDPLHSAAIRGRHAAVEALLDGGADPNVRDEDAVTPLHRAAGAGDSASILALVEAGADRAAKDLEGWTPFDLQARDLPERVRNALRPETAE
ncbi:MAG: hypothetical protein F4186_06545 [Boseongicola sp. SB0676_bin_33]|nr:hypothetical protein [Boseongicola sp. SB0676_bin_33]